MHRPDRRNGATRCRCRPYSGNGGSKGSFWEDGWNSRDPEKVALLTRRTRVGETGRSSLMAGMRSLPSYTQVGKGTDLPVD